MCELIVCEKSLLDRLDLNKPRGHNSPNQRSLGARTEANAVHNTALVDEASARLEGSTNSVVSVFEVLPSKIGYFGGESTTFVKGARDSTRRLVEYCMFIAHAKIVFAESRRLMDDSRACIVGHVCICNNFEGT